MVGKIFINYRRSRNARDAQHLATLLGKQFGDSRIFLDLRGIEGGEHWPHALERQVAASDVMVALIGKGWADVKDQEGNRRLDSSGDFVRFEIAQALARDIPVLPVVLDGAGMPKSAQLPQDIIEFSLRQPMPLRTESITQDAAAIADRIRLMLARHRPRQWPLRWVAAGAITALTAGVAIGAFGVFRPADSSLVRAVMNAEETRRTALTRVETLERDLANVTSERNDAVAERNKFRTDLTVANAELTKLRQEARDQRTAISSARGRIANLEQELDKQQKVLASVEAQRDQSLQDVNALTKQLETAKGRVAQLEEDIGWLGRAPAEAQAQRDQARQDVNTITKQLETAKDRVTRLEDDVRRLERARAEAQVQRDQASKEKGAAEARSAALTKELEVAKIKSQAAPTVEVRPPTDKSAKQVAPRPSVTSATPREVCCKQVGGHWKENMNTKEMRCFGGINLDAYYACADRLTKQSR